MDFHAKKKKSKRAVVFLGLGVVFLIFFIFAFGREFFRNYEISREIQKLEKQASDLESSNAELASFANKLNTLEFLEKEARLKFGLKKDGEEAVIIVSGQGYGSVIKNTLTGKMEKKEPTNIQKWWAYFFGYQASYASDDKNNGQ